MCKAVLVNCFVNDIVSHHEAIHVNCCAHCYGFKTELLLLDHDRFFGPTVPDFLVVNLVGSENTLILEHDVLN